MKKTKILVLCTGNSCRSQLAHAYLEHALGTQFEVFSAGVEKHGVNPKALAVLQEDGLDCNHYTSNLVDEYSHLEFQWVLTVCDNAAERCPIFASSAKKIHHDFKDPAKAKGSEEEIMNVFRNIRDEIKTFCLTWTDEIKQVKIYGKDD